MTIQTAMQLKAEIEASGIATVLNLREDPSSPGNWVIDIKLIDSGELETVFAWVPGDRLVRTARYSPYLDTGGGIAEEADHYVQRMRGSALSNWLEEVLREWLHQHYNQIGDDAFLRFETFLLQRVLASRSHPWTRSL